MNDQEYLLLAINAAVVAGQEVKRYYEEGFRVEWKADQSPVTEADLASDALIRQHLAAAALPVLSEEVAQAAYTERHHWTRYWCVDPIDGTRDFVARTNHFCICIAQINERKAHIGVIYLPVSQELYYAMQGFGAYKTTLRNAVNSLAEIDSVALPAQTLPARPTLLTSTYHINRRTQHYIEQLGQRFPQLQALKVGSAIKFCLLAEGKAHHYPRFGRMNDWDMAAGHAIVEAAGGSLRSHTGEEVLYNDENLYREDFMVWMGKEW